MRRPSLGFNPKVITSRPPRDVDAAGSSELDRWFKLKSSAFVLAGALLLGSCSDEVRSCELETSAIAMRVTVTDTEDGVDVEIIIEVGTDADAGSGTPLALCPDDDALNVNGEPATLTRVLGQLYYGASFQQPATDYRVELFRSNFDDAEVTVLMPPTLEILSPEEGSAHPRGVPLTVEWSPPWPGHELDLAIEDEIGSDCILGLGYQDDVVDSGSATVPEDALLNTSPGQPPTCEVWAALTRSAVGEYPPELHPSGSITAYVKRRRAFLSSE